MLEMILSVVLNTNTIIGIVLIVCAFAFLALVACLGKNQESQAAADDESVKEEVAEEVPVEASEAIQEEAAEPAAEVAEEAVVAQQEVAAAAADESKQLDIPRGVKRSFAEKIQLSEDSNKEIYNMLKNELMSYKKVTNRLTKTVDIFKYKRIYLAKISIAGKTIKLHLALDTNDYAVTKYHQKDMGDVKKYELVPFALKVKSERSQKYAVELIADVMAKAGLEKNAKYEATDYIAAFDAE